MNHCVKLYSRAIVTHNRRHFEKLHSESVKKQFEHAGIVIAGRRDVYENSMF